MIAVMLLLALTALRWLVAGLTPLAPDEAYYWIWSRTLQPGYLDHPPMVALWIRLGTALAGQTALGVRLLAPLAGLVGSLMLVDAADRLFPARRPGMAAAVLLNATLMLGAGTVTMTPDTPLLFFAVATLWALARVDADPRWWLAAGLAIGAALDSKYTGALLAVAPVLWLAGRRRWAAMRSPFIWAGAAIAAAAFAPVVAWNAGHGWISFVKQGGRTGNWQPQAAVQHVLELIGGQIGLATPLIFGLFAAGLWRVMAAWQDRASLLLACLAVPGLLVFVEHALGARVQANWLAILYPPLAIAAALVRARWMRAAAGLGYALTAVVYLQAAAAPFALPRWADPTLIRLADWDGLAARADVVRRANDLAFLASEDYSQAAELAWWAPPGVAVVGAEPRWRLFDLPEATPGSGSLQPGLLLISDKRRAGPDPAFWTDTVALGGLTRARAGVEAERFRVYRVTLRADAPAVRLPRPGGE